MTEVEFLQESTTEIEKLTSEIDDLLAKATDQTWQATNPDNGWTTAQIVEHLWRTCAAYSSRLEEAFAESPVATPGATIELGRPTKMILNGLAKRRTPAPRKLVVTEPISAQVALEHWNDFKAATRQELENAREHSLSQYRFRNPFVPIFKMSIADYLALEVEHLRYHAPQIRSRVET